MEHIFGGMAKGVYSAEQVEQLLGCTVSLCLDKLKKPKHFCRSSCIKVLIDLQTRMLPCPECHMEHRVGRASARGFSTNIIISGFSDLKARE